MAGDWEKLSDDFSGNDSALIAEVDCTIDSNAELCNGVKGYPTVKYGDPKDLSDYDGGRTYDALSVFAKENLGESANVLLKISFGCYPVLFNPN